MLFDFDIGLIVSNVGCVNAARRRGELIESYKA